MQKYYRLYTTAWQWFHKGQSRLSTCYHTHKSLSSAVTTRQTFQHSRHSSVSYYCNQNGSDFHTRQYSGWSGGELCFPVSNRTLVRVGGKDCSDFLQGLITNDVGLLTEGDPDVENNTSMYAMMLNIQGRVLYDLLLYLLPAVDGVPVFLIECDHQVAPELLKTMKRYKLRKKVTMDNVGDEYKVWAVLPPDVATDKTPVTLTLDNKDDVITCVPDPRLPLFGHRLLLRDKTNAHKVLPDNTVVGTEAEYIKRRYMMGLSEGILDLPSGSCTPLESNAAFLNGVSFSKGCYIGQELTARTHHTGVIRKRLMPINIIGDPGKLEAGTTVENAGGKNCGKFRNAAGRHGLALLRVADVIGKGELVVKNSDKEEIACLDTFVPPWWPRESDEIIKQVLSTVDKS